jgi:hypothetical protein
MKKVYLSFFGVLAFGLVGVAQKNTAKPLNTKKFAPLELKAKPGVVAPEKGITIWQNDFSNAAQWTTSNDPQGTPAHTAGDWTISTNVAGIPVAALAPAGHTTAANGFAFINSDAAGGNATQNASIVFNQNIDLSAEANVLLKFEQSHRRYAETTYVLWSTDGGATWNEVEVNGDMATNTNTTNPADYQVNLSNEIGGQDSVRIGFKYTGNFDWFWAIDDVKITTPDDHDVALSGLYWGSTGAWGARLPYYQIPTAQVTAIDFSGVIANNGLLNQNATFGVQAGAFVGSSAPTLIPAFSSDTADCTTSLTPAAANATITVNAGVQIDSTDATPADNTIAGAATIVVNPNIYARDIDDIASGSYNQGFGFEVGNIFDIYAADEISAIDVYIHPGANVGAEMYVKLYSIDAQTGDFVFVDESAPYTLGANDVDALLTLPLQGGAFTLNAGEPYLVVAGSNGDGGATDDLIVGTCGVSEAQTTFYLDLTDNTWYYTTATPMVRMNFSNASVNENSLLNSFNVSPNPAAGSATIALSGKAGADATISIVDVTGKEVYNTLVSSLNGTATVEVNTAAFGNGMYLVNVYSNGTKSSKKLIIRN